MIFFQKIKWSNFLSTGNQPIEIDLNKHSTTLILGENGSGKSTLLCALTFVLFGKPFRNINKPQLVNSLNQSDCLVEIYFIIGKNEYFIRRGLKPSIFEIYINEKLVNQDSRIKDYQVYLEENILKLNYRSFCQVVVLGSSTFVPFMQLKASDRRFIIEDLLDIQIFSYMNGILKQKIIELREQFTKLDNDISLIDDKIKLRRQYVEELRTNNKERISVCNSSMKDNKLDKVVKLKEIKVLEKEIEKLTVKCANEDSIRAIIRKLELLEDQLTSSAKKLEKELIFFGDTEVCPTCKQNINDMFKVDIITEKKLKLKEVNLALVKLDKDLQNKRNILDLICDILGRIVDKKKDISKINSSIIAIESYMEKIQNEIKELLSKKTISDKDKKELKLLEAEREECVNVKDRFFEDKHYYDLVAQMLKDSGIKTRIISRYLPIINKSVNKYLNLLDFFVNFTLDENFKEIIKSRGRDEFSYESFSEGEKLRIDLSLLFTWRDISKMKNSANTNLLILDEIFDSSLDTNGTEDFLKLIGQLNTNINIFIISHKGDTLQDKFQNTIRFVKVKNFSLLKKE